MAVKKQPESDAGALSEPANDWFRQFLKHLEIFMVEAGQVVRSDAEATDYRLAAMRAVKLTLLDSGMDDDEFWSLVGRVAIEDVNTTIKLEWSAELNKRRFELIDSDIQGTITPVEQVELAGLTHLMREHVDSEDNLPFEGAKKLHRFLTETESESTDLEQ